MPDNISTNRENKALSDFLSTVLKQIGDQFDPAIVSEFHRMKNLRERVLTDKWTGGPDNSTRVIYRQVDYDHLLALIHNKLPVDDPGFLDLHFTFVTWGIRYGEYEKVRNLLYYLDQVIPDHDVNGRARFYYHQAKLKRVTNQFARSEYYYKEALKGFLETDDTVNVVKTYNFLGITCFEQWKTREGKEFLLRARETLEESGLKQTQELLEKIDINLGVVEGMRGKYQDAVRIFDNLLQRMPGDVTMNRVVVLADKGKALLQAGAFQRAEQVLRSALRGAKSLTNIRWIASISLDLAEVHIRTGREKKGEELLISAFEHYSSLSDRIGIADTYRLFGIHYHNLRQYDLAANYFDMSISMHKEFNNLLGLMEAYYEYSQLVKKQGDTFSQKRYILQSRKYAESIGASHWEEVCNKILSTIAE